MPASPDAVCEHNEEKSLRPAPTLKATQPDIQAPPPARRDRLAGLGAVLVILAAVTAAMWNVVRDPWRAVQEDMAYQWQGMHAAANEQILAGHFPHWSPYWIGGERLFANVSLGLFYPGSVLFRFLPFPIAAVWTWLLHYSLTAIGVYAFARTVLYTARPAAVLAAMAFALGGFSLGHCNHLNFVMALPYLPLLLLGTYHFCSPIERAGKIRWWLLGLVSLSCMILSGGTPILMMALVALAWLVAVLAWHAIAERDFKRAARIVIAVAAMGIAALGLTACQLLPTLDLYAASARQDWSEDNRDVGAVPWQTLLCQLLAPGILGNQTVGLWGYANHETSFFVGGVVLSFAVGGLLSLRHRAWVVPIALLLALSLALAVGWSPLLRLMELLLPGINMRQPSRYLGLVHLAVAFLAAIGVDSWLKPSRPDRFGPFAGIGIAVTVFTCLSYAAICHWIGDAASSTERFYAWRASQPPILQGWLGDSRPHAIAAVTIARNARLTTCMAAWALAGLVVFGATLLRQIRLRRAAVGLVCGGSMIELMLWAGGTWAWQDRSPDVPDQPTSITRFLQQNLGDMRYLNPARYPPLLANRSAIYGLRNTEGYLGSKLNVPRENHELWLRLGGQTTAVNLFSTKYVLLRENQPPGALVPVFREGDMVVCENPASVPRAFFLGRVRWVGNTGETISIMRSGSFDPRTTGLVCGTARQLDETYPPAGSDEQYAFTEEHSGEVEINTPVRCCKVAFHRYFLRFRVEGHAGQSARRSVSHQCLLHVAGGSTRSACNPAFLQNARLYDGIGRFSGDPDRVACGGRRVDRFAANADNPAGLMRWCSDFTRTWPAGRAAAGSQR